MDLRFLIVCILGSFKNKQRTQDHNWAGSDSDAQNQQQQYSFDCFINELKKPQTLFFSSLT